MSDFNTIPSVPQAPVSQAVPAADFVPPAAQATQMPQADTAAQTSQMPPTGAPVPPVGQAAQQQFAPAAPQNIMGMPLLRLTGGMKFGWAVCGFVMGPIAILLAWLTNAHNFPEAKSAAVKFSLFGFLAQFLIAFLVLALFGMAACAAATGSFSMGYYY